VSYRKVLDQVNRTSRDKADDDAPEVLGSEALRAYLAEHPCGGC
jgi:hypothetical protein